MDSLTVINNDGQLSCSHLGLFNQADIIITFIGRGLLTDSELI